MEIDIRLSVEFFDHPKTIKLQRRIGLDGVMSLIKLWLWCRINRPSGILSGMDIEDIEIAAKWTGEHGTFVNEALTLGWLELNEDTYALHDWEDNNGWAAKTEERSNAARLSRMAKTHPEIHKKLISDGVKGVTKQEFQSLTKDNNDRLTVVNESLTPAPAPAPAHNANTFDGEKFLEEYCDDKQLIDDWLKVRRTKKAANTETAFKGFITAVNKSNLSVSEALRVCCENNWKGFNVKWLETTGDVVNLDDHRKLL